MDMSRECHENHPELGFGYVQEMHAWQNDEGMCG